MKKYLKILVLFILIVVYLILAIKHSNTINIDASKFDQHHYIRIVKEIHQKNFWYLGDRNRTPLYPYIQAIFYTPGMDDKAFFQQGKFINIFISLLMLFLIFKKISKYLEYFGAIVFILLTAFTLFILKAPYFQTEVLFYSLYFFTFIYILKTLKKGQYKDALFAGVFAAITYLVKATALMGFTLFIGFLIAHIIRQLIKNTTYAKKLLICTLISFMGFILILSPYLIENKKIYNKFFYNVNTNFYMWYDSWAEVVKGTRAHGDTLGWPDMPKEMIPGPAKYLKEHTFKQIINRQKLGLFFQMTILTRTYAAIPFSFILLSLLLSIYLILVERKSSLIFLKDNLVPFLFVIIYIFIHINIFAWYMLIEYSPRFIFSLFLPFLFVTFMVIENIAIGEISVSSLVKLKKSNLIYLIILLSLVIAFPNIVKTILGGYT